MNKLAIITPCSRVKNLYHLEVSIGFHSESTTWFICYDREIIPSDGLYYGVHINFNYYQNHFGVMINQTAIKGGVSGNLQRNRALDELKKENFDGWVYILDDDNILHPDFFTEINKLITNNPEARGFIFAQEGVSDGKIWIRKNTSDNIKVNYIDQAQFILHTDLIKDKRYQQRYEADGIFIDEIYQEHKDKIIISDEVLCYYNFLRR
jgi:hypothetical protein